ncbi:Hypothetical predicted protein [Paramuricea clavata]|uniref:Uncharacterized protein n=1 Tax=Paramuricea clavata TaxID=317549 RepID=A0A6S7JWE7_PARCT|nr:Hypothetical predicted protein [Paramuricea clavata]
MELVNINSGVIELSDGLELDQVSGEIRKKVAKRVGKLVFDPILGQLREASDPPSPDLDSLIWFPSAREGFSGANFVASSAMDKITIKPKLWFKRDVIVKTMHISCKSDTYKKAHSYAGVIIYQYNGKSEWRTANNTHCKSGYIVIQDTESENVKRWRNDPVICGAVHGAVYKNAFGESKKKSVVGEGFAIQNGEIKFNSGVFNNPQGSAFHDDRRWMNKLSEHCIRKIVEEEWMTAGSSGVKQRNFDVKQLLCDFDIANNPTLQVDEDNYTRSCNIL